MSDAERVLAPTPGEIERRFRSPAVRIARPCIHGGLGLLGFVRGFKWTAEGAARLLDEDLPIIFAANHVSHADTAAILCTLPRRIRKRTCVAAALDVFGDSGERRTLKSFRRECLQVIVAGGFHAFAFDRHGPPLRSVRTAAHLVRGGWNLLLYPEGTRSRSGEVAPFKLGVGVLARTTGRPVVPVFVRGGDDVLPCGAFLPRPGRIVVRYGEPMRLRHGEPVREFVTRLEARVRRLGELRGGPAEAPPEPAPGTVPPLPSIPPADAAD